MKYSLFDLEIVTIGDPKTYNCSHSFGDGLLVKGENVQFKPGTKQFSHYVLATLVPYIAAKQRADKPNDWMYYESDIACPDPGCGARFQIKRLKKTSYNYKPKNKTL